jgi:hypothetical protein
MSNEIRVDVSFEADMAARHIVQMADGILYEQTRPSTLYKPTVSRDGNQWCALLGENLQVGVAGFGDSPAQAMYAFDLAWVEVIK